MAHFPFQKVETNIPLHIVFLGDFSAHSAKGYRSPIHFTEKLDYLEIDRDNLDQIMEELKIVLRLPTGNKRTYSMRLALKGIHDFHPENLCQNLIIFRELRRFQSRLKNARTFEIAADEIFHWFQKSNGIEKDLDQSTMCFLPLQEDAKTISSSSSYFKVGTDSFPNDDSTVHIVSLLEDIITPYLYQRNFSPYNQRDCLQVVEDAWSFQMRNILQAGALKRVESLWRGLHFLISRLEQDTKVNVYIADITKKEFVDSLYSHDQNIIHRILNNSNPEEKRHVLLGCYAFKKNEEDIDTLAKIAKIAQKYNTPFVAEADAQFLSQEKNEYYNTVNKAWESMRALPEASHLGLMYSKFILRIPYGIETDPVHYGYNFEEYSSNWTNNHYLWGNPVFALAYLLGKKIAYHGWDLDFHCEEKNVIDNLPIYAQRIREKNVKHACISDLLTKENMLLLQNQGIVPLSEHSDGFAFPDLISVSNQKSKLFSCWKKQM